MLQKKFNEAEIIYPQSVWAPRASLMAAYAYFSQAYYEDAILELNRFIKKYNNLKLMVNSCIIWERKLS